MYSNSHHHNIIIKWLPHCHTQCPRFHICALLFPYSLSPMHGQILVCLPKMFLDYATPNFLVTIVVIGTQIEFTTTMAGDLSAQ